MRKVVNSTVSLAGLLLLMLAPRPGIGGPGDPACLNLETTVQAQERVPILGSAGFHNLDLALAIDQRTPDFAAAIDTLIKERGRNLPKTKSGPSKVGAPIFRSGGESTGSSSQLTGLADSQPAVPVNAANQTLPATQPAVPPKDVRSVQTRTEASKIAAQQSSHREDNPPVGTISKSPPSKRKSAKATPNAAEVLDQGCRRLLAALATTEPNRQSIKVAGARKDLLSRYRERLRRTLKITDVKGCEDVAAKASEHYVLSANATDREGAKIFANWYRRCLDKKAPTVRVPEAVPQKEHRSRSNAFDPLKPESR